MSSAVTLNSFSWSRTPCKSSFSLTIVEIILTTVLSRRVASRRPLLHSPFSFPTMYALAISVGLGRPISERNLFASGER